MNADLHALSGAYAADALTLDEAELFEIHLHACAPCTEEVRELRETGALLGLAVALTPPPTLRAAVLGRIDTVRQLPPEPDVPALAAATGAAGARPGTAPSEPLDAEVRASPGHRWGRPVLAVAASVLVLALALAGAAGLSLRNQLDEAQAQAQSVTSVLTASDARTVNAALRNGGTATLIVSARRGTAVFVGAGLSAVGGDRTYQLWLIGADGATSAGVFRPDEDGRTTTTLIGDPANADAVGVTVEPGDGSTQPTSPPVVALSLRA